jgi:hypothetical protein
MLNNIELILINTQLYLTNIELFFLAMLRTHLGRQSET